MPARRSALDADQRFMRRRLALYLSRVLERRPVLDYEALQLYGWLVGARCRRLSQVITLALEGDARTRFAQALRESEDDGDRARALLRAVEGQPRVRGAVQQHLRAELARLTRRETRGGCLQANLEHLQTSFGLTAAEAEYCLFLYLVAHCSPADRYFEHHLDATKRTGRSHLAVALGLSASQLLRAMTGKVRQLGIVEECGGWFRVSDEFIPLFDEPWTSERRDRLFRPARPPAVPLEAHLVEPTTTVHLLRLLRPAPTRGPVHLLLYGAPGTGKTSYARGLAEALRLPAYEVLPDRDNRVASERAAVLACLNLTNHGSGSLIIVDEADGILGTEAGWLVRGEAQDKGWLNHLLEEPGVRMIWIVNRVDGIAESVRRRFAHSVAFRPFGRRERLRIWETVVETHRALRVLPREELTALAAEYELGAGAIESAVRSASLAGARSRRALGRAIRGSLEAHRTLLADGEPARPRDALEEDFTLAAVSASGNLRALLRRLEAADRQLRADPSRRLVVNLLFHGPPGTGKSELARHLARHLGREPLVRRASDILSMWVGEAEKALAQAFAEAEHEDAVLILDEVDTFLHSRELAQRSWEVSLVNELLVQLERARGLVIATTNRLEALDPACLRRFQVKLGLDYLTAEGRRLLYARLLAPLAGSPPHAALLEELAGLPPLAAGDFRVVRDRFALEGGATHAALLVALAEEAELRAQHAGRRVGFLG